MATPLKRPRDPAQLAKLMIDIASGEVEDRAPDIIDPAKDPAEPGTVALRLDFALTPS